jgi:hypothetical protein
MERKGQWIMTYTGKKFHLLDPHPDEVDIMDITHALSNVCRYTGHTKYFYSVATHSILCVDQARKDNMTAKMQLYIALHDASEAYLTDVNRPLKSILGKIYTDLEDKVTEVIFEHFGLPQPTEQEWKTVKYYDDFVLANEIPQLMLNAEEFGIEPIYNGIQIPRYGNVHVENRFRQIIELLLKEYEEEKANV